ncbi:uncharacterized protein LOC127252339 [Andrographis paniculata]|uniref:uncharacterized protein LOC127252339 n=1 Tax=Andrographis paniculata TaxID=175694 RepID=UPI0021E8AAA9|nr:uncharacterized protein LOC127252339 [Andrographis paniculata]
MSSTQPESLNEDAQEAAEEEELQALEQQVENMAKTILQYRTTLPDHLTSTLSSLLASQRPLLPPHLLQEEEEDLSNNAPLPAPQSEARPTQDPSDPNDAEEAEKIRILKQKISRNASAIPVVLNRMKECMSRIDKLEPSNGVIHPAFKRNGGT